jgi:hypothetical protein
MRPGDPDGAAHAARAPERRWIGLGRKKRGKSTALLAAGLLLSGCLGHPARVHPRYAERGLPDVGVAAVENQTLIPLEEVDTADLIERTTRGGRKTSIPVVLQRALIEALVRKGYRASAWKPPPAREEAVLISAITNWDRSGIFRDGRVKIEGSLKLVRLSAERSEPGDDDLLFQTTFRYESPASSAGLRTTLDVEKEVRSAGFDALRGLPPATVLEGVRRSSSTTVPSRFLRRPPLTGRTQRIVKSS